MENFKLYSFAVRQTHRIVKLIAKALILITGLIFAKRKLCKPEGVRLTVVYESIGHDAFIEVIK